MKDNHKPGEMPYICQVYTYFIVYIVFVWFVCYLLLWVQDLNLLGQASAHFLYKGQDSKYSGFEDHRSPLQQINSATLAHRQP